MKLNTFHVASTSVAAIGGLALGTYNATVAQVDRPHHQPVQISLAVDPQIARQQRTTAQETVLVKVADNQAKRPRDGAGEKDAKRQVADAPKLLGNMRASLGLISAEYAATSEKTPAHKSSGLVVAATRQAALDIEGLEKSIQSKDPKRVSEATKVLSKSIGKLQTTYAIIPEKTPRVDTGMRTLSSNWSAYCSRYALAAPGKASRNATEIKKLKARVNELSERVADLESKTASNAALHREVVRLRADLNDYRRREDSYEAYQSLLLTLAVVDGMFDAFYVTTRVYYPTYYVYFEPYYASRGFWEVHWTGYYDAYYADAGWGWYHESFVVPETLVIAPAPEVVVYQNVTYQEINVTTQQTVNVYEALPPEDLTAVEVAAPPKEAYSAPVAIQAASEAPQLQLAPAGADAVEPPNTGGTNAAAPPGEPPRDAPVSSRTNEPPAGDRTDRGDKATEGPLPTAEEAAKASQGAAPARVDNLDQSNAPPDENSAGAAAPAHGKETKTSEDKDVEQPDSGSVEKGDAADSEMEPVGEPDPTDTESAPEDKEPDRPGGEARPRRESRQDGSPAEEQFSEAAPAEGSGFAEDTTRPSSEEREATSGGDDRSSQDGEENGADGAETPIASPRTR
jgi:hypothetical protein